VSGGCRLNRMQDKTALVIGTVGEVAVRRVVASSSAEVYGELPGTALFGLTGTTKSPDYQQPDRPLSLTQNMIDVANGEKLLGSVADPTLEVGIGHQFEFQRAQMETTP
jgi:hypothetical protein